MRKKRRNWPSTERKNICRTKGKFSSNHHLQKGRLGYCMWVPRWAPGTCYLEGAYLLFFTRWWQLKYFLCSPLLWERWTHFDEHIFQMGWKQQVVDILPFPPKSFTFCFMCFKNMCRVVEILVAGSGLLGKWKRETPRMWAGKNINIHVSFEMREAQLSSLTCNFWCSERRNKSELHREPCF